MSVNRPVALVTNAMGFAGPGAVAGLLATGYRVFAQDPAFSESTARERFCAGRDNLLPIECTDPREIISDISAREGRLDAVVSNDHFPAPGNLPEDADTESLQANYRFLVEAPFRLVQAALPLLRDAQSGNVVMITSNRTRLPLSGAAFPDAARAAANALVRSLAVDLAGDGIVVNAVAPNFLYSETYYPKAVFEHTEAGRAHVRHSVPVGRLAGQDEIGEVIAFLASVKTRFLTGAVIDFSGGWPFGASRPEVSDSDVPPADPKSDIDVIGNHGERGIGQPYVEPNSGMGLPKSAHGSGERFGREAGGGGQPDQSGSFLKSQSLV
ncbi:SDR family oxidoreductase [uncultured Hoeflea sp.]|uniref:SDR family oxidoreductase n=1 Tax=uncultured Hoeflea sp. TaxID=538666 RepID=UPI0030DBD8DB